MKLELNKTYITKRGIPVKITMKTEWGFFGTLQDNSKRVVKYNDSGKVVYGPKSGNLLDIQDENEKPRKTITKSSNSF